VTTAPHDDEPRSLHPSRVEHVVRLLESDWGAAPTHGGVLAHQQTLAALDAGAHDRFRVWPGFDPVGVLYHAPSGTSVVAGRPEAADALARAAEAVGWRVLIGDAAVNEAVLDALPKGLLRKRFRAREQRFMVAVDPPAAPDPLGLRLARMADLQVLVEQACQLHVEDEMGLPIGRSGRPAVRARMLDSVRRGATWVVERDGRAVAKVDVSLYSERRGAQIAGVYVDAAWRGHGLATGAVAGVTRRLLAEGLPGITLHVRADNGPAIAAYRHAGYTDHGAWILALR
jgi:uncharacterized protein